jgi:hypothetical protein
VISQYGAGRSRDLRDDYAIEMKHTTLTKRYNLKHFIGYGLIS